MKEILGLRQKTPLNSVVCISRVSYFSFLLSSSILPLGISALILDCSDFSCNFLMGFYTFLMLLNDLNDLSVFCNVFSLSLEI